MLQRARGSYGCAASRHQPGQSLAVRNGYNCSKKEKKKCRNKDGQPQRQRLPQMSKTNGDMGKDTKDDKVKSTE